MQVPSRVTRWVSPGTEVSSTTYECLATNKPYCGRKSYENRISNSQGAVPIAEWSVAVRTDYTVSLCIGKSPGFESRGM